MKKNKMNEGKLLDQCDVKKSLLRRGCKNFNKAFSKTTAGNYFGYYNGYYIYTFRRPHKHWCSMIGRKGKYIWSEGYFGTSLKTLQDAKNWAKFKIMPQCKTPYHTGYVVGCSA